MELQMKLKKRWITAILREANKTEQCLPWQRGYRGHSSSQRGTPPSNKAKIVSA